MIIENISALKVQKLSQDQFDNARENNTLDNNSIYLTPTVVKDYALKSDLKEKADLIDGKIPLEQLPDDVVSRSEFEEAIAAIYKSLSATTESGDA